MAGNEVGGDIGTSNESCRGAIKRIGRDGVPRTPDEFQRAILKRTGELYSDGTITRRLRELRETRHGGWVVRVTRSHEIRPDGKRSRDYEYALLTHQLSFA